LIEEAFDAVQEPLKVEEEVGIKKIPATPEPLKEESPEETPKEVIQSSITETPKDSTPGESEINDSKESESSELAEDEFGVPTKAQLNKINKFAKRKLTKEEVFVAPVKFVGDGLLKDRALKLDESLLRVYLKDAKKGIAFMLDHPWAGFFAKPKPAYTYGRSFDAALVESPGNPEVLYEKFVLEGWIYIVRGKEKDGVSTDEIIKDIEDGTLFDGSVGFYFETAECSICGKSIWECPHWPGEEYEEDGKKHFCYVIAKPPGGLMEYSGVFDGAYPTAGFSADGEAEPAAVEVTNIKDVPKGTALRCVYSAQYGLRMYRKKEPNKESKETPKPLIDVERAKEIAGANWQSKILDMADEGRILRVDLIEDALKCGVKAMGNAFDADLHKSLFEKSSVEEIKRYRDQFMRKAKEDLSNERQVVPMIATSQSTTPPLAFKISR